MKYEVKGCSMKRDTDGEWRWLEENIGIFQFEDLQELYTNSLRQGYGNIEIKPIGGNRWFILSEFLYMYPNGLGEV